MKDELGTPPEMPTAIFKRATPDESVNLDPEKFEKARVSGNKIDFAFDKPCMVRVLARNKDRYYGVVKTIVDWENREPGEYTEVWDGKNDNGDLQEIESCDITVETQPRHGEVDYDSLEQYYLPDDYILRKTIGLEKQLGAVTVEGKPHWVHSSHHHGKCHNLHVEIADVAPVNNGEGLYNVKVNIGKDGEKRGYGKDKVNNKKNASPIGHSIRIYVDNYLFDEDKTIIGDKAEWLLDVSQIPKGEHTLSVSVCDHHDHHGSDSVKINVS
jgi:hypothetical protein